MGDPTARRCEVFSIIIKLKFAYLLLARSQEVYRISRIDFVDLMLLCICLLIFIFIVKQVILKLGR